MVVLAASGSSVPSYCPPGKQTLTGYDVSQTVQVKVHDLSKAGALFQAVGNVGVQNVQDLQFSIDNQDNLKDQARAAAIVKARASADKLATELGVSLVRIVSFTESGSSPTLFPMMYATGASLAEDKAAAPQIPAGQQKISDTVQVTYEIR